jgi:hypothetical protein
VSYVAFYSSFVSIRNAAPVGEAFAREGPGPSIRLPELWTA